MHDYSTDDIYAVIKKYHDGMKVTTICKEFDIPKSTFYYWAKKYGTIKSSKKEVTMWEHHLLGIRLAQVEQENRIFRLSKCTMSAPLKEKLEAIAQLRSEFSINALCDVLEVNLSTAKSYISRKDTPTKTELRDDILRVKITEIFEDSQQRFGAKKIKVKLDKEGYVVSQKKIQRLMNQLNLKCNRAKPPKKYQPEKQRQYSRNFLNREFNQKVPNTAWVSDITYYKVKGINCYICVVIDLFSRMVLSFEVASNLSSTIVSTPFLEAYVERGLPKNLTFHSDQGSQYLCGSLQMRLCRLGVRQSFSKPGCPYDNAVVESFFASLKKEELHRTEYTDISQLRIAVESYIHFFNEVRPHQSLGYLTPSEVEKNYTIAQK